MTNIRPTFLGCSFKNRDIFAAMLVLLLLPIDWFSITGDALRELGAKPAIVLLVILSLLEFFRSLFKKKFLRLPTTLASEFFALIILGLLAFCLSIIMDRVSFQYFKNPFLQFIAQTGLLILFFFTIIFLTNYFRRPSNRILIVRLLPFAASIHLSIFLFEALGFEKANNILLSTFRNSGVFIERPSGLMSEPSYFGAFAGLFGMPLLLINYFKKYIYRILGVTLLVAAYYINAKTMFVVIAFQLVIFWFLTKKNISLIKLVIVTFIIGAGALVLNVSQKPLDVGENLSSAMRLGSSILGLNLVLDGYGLTGVGIGQFHFFYKREYAPPFLLFSNEAATQFEPSAVNRASTYNLFVRLLVETGFIGLLLFLDIIRRALKKVRFSDDPANQFSILLVSGSVGFLMTQDTYFYPPLALGLALAFSSSKTGAFQKTL